MICKTAIYSRIWSFSEIVEIFYINVISKWVYLATEWIYFLLLNFVCLCLCIVPKCSIAFLCFLYCIVLYSIFTILSLAILIVINLLYFDTFSSCISKETTLLECCFAFDYILVHAFIRNILHIFSMRYFKHLPTLSWTYDLLFVWETLQARVEWTTFIYFFWFINAK